MRRRTAQTRALALVLLMMAAFTFSLAVAEVCFRVAGYSAIYDVYSRPSLLWRYDPLLGWSHEPGARDTYVGPRPFPLEFRSPVEINSLGLRGPEVKPRAPGEYRVLFLGDSVTVGREVASEDTLTAILEKQLTRRLDRPIRVINAAVRGYGTDQLYLDYRERGRLLEPDAVVLVHSGNDPTDNMTLHKVRRPFGKPALAPQPDGNLELVGHPVPEYSLCEAWVLSTTFEPERVDNLPNRVACWFQTRLADRSALFSFAAATLARFPGLVRFLKDLSYPGAQNEGERRTQRSNASILPLSTGSALTEDPARSRDEAETELTTQILLALVREVRDDEARFLIVPAPTLTGIRAQALEATNVALTHVAVPAGVPPHLFRWKNDGHLNERGHALYADQPLPVLAEWARGHDEGQPGMLGGRP